MWIKWCINNFHRIKSYKMKKSLNSALTVDNIPYTVIKEGLAEVLFPSSNDVFYNPVQEFNRDISVAVIKQFIGEFPHQNIYKRKSSVKEINNSLEMRQVVDNQCDIRILEALAASGLRSIRYAKEIPNISNIVANDYSQQAVESMKRNIKHNHVEHIVTPTYEEASLLMYQHRKPQKQFYVVDIDPYGSPAPFIDAAVQCVADGGLLLVTCTDMAILCGNHSETCHAKYGAVSLKSKNCHEMALRIILQSIESQANRYGRYIIPLLSLSADFYIRVFVKIHTSPSEVKKSVGKLAMVFKCTGCETFHLQPLAKTQNEGRKISPSIGPVVGMTCNHCGHKHQIGGPIWANSLYNKDFIQKLLKTVEQEADLYKTAKRMIGVLNVITEELEEQPLYYVLPDLCAVVHSVTPSMLEFRSAILNAGYQVSLSHACQNSVKTNAPDEVIWDIVREWVKLHPVKRDLTGTAGGAILSKDSRMKVSFEVHPQANPTSRLQNMCRFQLNPEPFWGPKTRAKTSIFSEKQIEKKKRFQGKRNKNRTNTDCKQYPCKKFKKGECDLGNNCRYSHDIAITTEKTVT